MSIDIYIVDDGSTDGTSAAIKENFPSAILIQGTGTLFWNQGMRRAWSAALDKGHDYYLWLHDDTHIYEDSVARIVQVHHDLIEKAYKVGAIVGSVVDPTTKEVTYGGRKSISSLNPTKFGPVEAPSNESIECNFINGNFTLIPAASVDKIGILSNHYSHSMGDFDYGLRLQKAGFSCFIAPGAFGECRDNPVEGGWSDKSLSKAERIKKTKSITQLPPVKEWQYYVKSHGGFVWPILWFKAWVRGRFPSIFLYLRSR